ncbi:helix-turn-helix domain-containing protein [Candidatus Thiodiazotropha sp. CDECU1]|uniref:helix-turn-helix domain-containing protein n=1 Tax=Candidatus Thiodiazotropha sp. CDECU1 TaxID=3065865 RepID=UPI00292ED8A2|nr:RodZ domain-containing protein [Candidatus Thiodiazotropha sp. CDECU1]
MNAINKDESVVTPEAVIGPGSQLRKARERQGLDQAKMAAQLHLSQAMIAALEVDDFDNLPGPVFVQGYLRKYSRLLGVNENAVIEAYQSLLPVSDELPIQGSQKQELSRELHSGHGVIRYVTWGILLILAGLLFFWWQTRVELEEPESVAAEDQLETVVQDPVVEQVIPQPQPQPQPAEVDMPQPDPPSEEVVEASERLLNEIDDVITTSDQLLAPLEDKPSQPAEQAQPDPVNLPTQEVEPTPEVVAVVSKRVVFLFNESCWTEVRDRDGKLRIFGELAAGKRRTLDSRLGPFSVLLGNAAGVELNIDGEAFDLKPFTRGKVARFTLDPNRL